METRSIMVVGVWTFATVWLVGMLAIQGDMLTTLLLFFIAIAVSVGAVALPTGKKPT